MSTYLFFYTLPWSKFCRSVCSKSFHLFFFLLNVVLKRTNCGILCFRNWAALGGSSTEWVPVLLLLLLVVVGLLVDPPRSSSSRSRELQVVPSCAPALSGEFQTQKNIRNWTNLNSSTRWRLCSIAEWAKIWKKIAFLRI